VLVLVSLQAYKSLIKIETMSCRIIQTTFDGNPKTTITSCYIPTDVCGEQDGEIYMLLSETKSSPKAQYPNYWGDMNAKVKSEDSNRLSFSGKSNANGLALLTLLEECNTVLLNTQF